MLEEIMELDLKWKIAIVAFIIVVAVAILSFPGPGQGGSSSDDASQQDGQEQTDDPSQQDGDGGETVGDWLGDQSWFRDLSTEQKTLAVYIANNKWQDASNSESLSFSADGTALYARNGSTTEEEWSLSDVQPDGGDATHGTCVLKLGDDTYILQCTATTPRDLEVYADATDSELVSKAFENVLYRVRDAEGFSVTGTDSTSGFTDLVPADSQNIFNADLKDWCKQNAPSSTGANWVGSYTVKRADDGSGSPAPQKSTYFTCNDSNRTKVYVTFDSTGAWSFSDRGSTDQ